MDDISHKFSDAKFELEKKFATRPPDALKPVWKDLEFLWNFCIQNEIQKVCEFGSGCSTAVFRELQERGLLFALDTLDSEQKWAEASGAKLVPVYRLDHPLYGPVWRYNTTYYERHVVYYQHDLIYLDGPELTKDVRITINPLFMDWEWMIIDGREDCVDFYRKNLGPHDFDGDWEERRYVFRRIPK